MMKDKTIVVYTDGASSKNGLGGWAALLIYPNGSKDVVYGNEIKTTNNRMELTAVIEGILACDPWLKIEVYSDSEYVVKGITDWIYKWKTNGWKNSTFEDVVNKDLWEKLEVAIVNKDVNFFHVKGHADNVYNNFVDAVAGAIKVNSREVVEPIINKLLGVKND